MLSRRALLKHAALSAGALVRFSDGRHEVVIQAVSAVTVRIVIRAAAGAAAAPLDDDGALVSAAWPRFKNRRIRVAVTPDLTIRVRDGARLVQQMRADTGAGTLSFQIGDRPLLGLGEGGLQFDRRGTIDEMKNGQGGYRLRTHGGRVPIQWMVGTGGWALYMLPYIYTAARECCDTGLPMMRALWLHYPDDPVAVARGDQYLWGRDVLVAPVVESGATSRMLYLPRGRWFDHWTEEPLDGGREITRPVDLETMPLYVRAGAIMSLDPLRQYTSEPVDGPLTLVVYPGADGTSALYDDDGIPFEHRRGVSLRMRMAWQDAGRTLTLSLARGSRMLGPRPRPIEIRTAGESRTRSVSFDGSPLTVKL